jgi:putative ABC transport system permease protein
MRRLREWWSRFRGYDDLADLDEEVEFHLEMEARRYIDSGLTPEQARRAARANFGNEDRWREEMRDNDPLHPLSDLSSDVRVGVRALGKTPAATLTAIVALMLGIGLTTLMFSIVYGVILQDLPFDGANRLVSISYARELWPGAFEPVSYHDFTDWQSEQRSFEDVGAFTRRAVTLRYGNHPARYEGALVTASLFEVLRVRPVMGRTISAADDRPGAPLVVLLSHAVWQRDFGADPAIVGRVIQAEGELATVIGVMPARFAFPTTEEVWLPWRMDTQRVARDLSPVGQVIGRLAEGVTIDQARAELTTLARRFAAAYPTRLRRIEPIRGLQSRGGSHLNVHVRPLKEALIPERVKSLLYTLLAAVVLVLLIACSNVANILISRGVLRAREIGVRSALGASRYRIIRQFLTESTLLAASGAVLGSVLAVLGMRLFTNAIASTQAPFWIDIRLHGGVIMFVAALTIVAALVAGAIPAWQAARTDANATLKDDSRTSTNFRLGRLSRTLVVLELALSVGLLVGAGLTIRSVIKLTHTDFGFDPHHVFVSRIELPGRNYRDPAARRRFYSDLQAQLDRVPGVTAVALTSGVPGLGLDPAPYMIHGRVYSTIRDYPSAPLGITTPAFLDLFGAQPMRGRKLTGADGEHSEPVALVSATLAEREFPAGNAIGSRIRIVVGPTEEAWRTIVGIVPDINLGGLNYPDQAGIIVPLTQGEPRDEMMIVARTNGHPLDITTRIRAAVAAVDPQLPVYDVNTLRGAIDREGVVYWIFGSMFVVFGVAALLLAAIGVYGVMATGVRQRTREIGVRMALGADRAAVLRLVVGQAMIQLGLGLALGLSMAFFLGRLLAIILFRLAPADPITFFAIISVITGTALLATLLPAARAARVHPIESLRHD